ncbi:NADP-reducing hydrogenase subunit HndB [Limihaloglobus sulfuriphilus]|uniref:NADP-reducing hydrogenase subunit HndB n=1 Tax=Limihaloglobus sulfuriphilus TaxID=1851148 RepID=A0A1Q2MEY3_9BACT|nr:(2Fe-2S) ferredoxin domain-containing protein [Limihaloglobus sulfuriphilus]AQQ71214.1 NADP-reducing hydrogenase subunit HndB [Limihaloglobus sulfuriphilus]
MSTPLEQILQKQQDALSRNSEKSKDAQTKIFVGMATCEIAAGSRKAMEVFKNAIEAGELENVYLSQKGCAGRCNLEPTVEIYEKGKVYQYGKVSAKRAEDIIEKHLKNGQPIKEWFI